MSVLSVSFAMPERAVLDCKTARSGLQYGSFGAAKRYVLQRVDNQMVGWRLPDGNGDLPLQVS
jgi:hypothetical protein